MNNIIKSIQSILVFVICLGFSFPQAYNISGTILDSDTKIPIQDVNIFIKNSELGTITDKTGYFSLFLNTKIDSNDIIIGAPVYD